MFLWLQGKKGVGERNKHFRKENAKLKNWNEKIVEEGDEEVSQMDKEKPGLEEKIKEFRALS